MVRAIPKVRIGRRSRAIILAPLVIAEFDAEAAFAYGQLRTDLEAQGTPIGSLDTLIAGHAVSLGVKVVTNNEREFSRVPNLKVEIWVSD